MEDEARPGEEQGYAERYTALAAERRRLSLASAETAEQVAAVEREVAALHEQLAAAHPGDARYAEKADHARRSAENAESFAIVERKVADTESAHDAHLIFEPYERPTPQAGHEPEDL